MTRRLLLSGFHFPRAIFSGLLLLTSLNVASNSAKPALSALLSANLDRPSPTDAEFELLGRLNKLPVSGFHKVIIPVQAGNDLAFRSPCSQPAGTGVAFRICDTGMIVTYSEASIDRTLFNDDGPFAEVGGNGRGSYVRVGQLSSPTTSITVYVFSMRRATSSTQLQINFGLGVGWQTLSPALEVGGTLVRVGPLLRGDFVEVLTPDNGAEQNNTQMLLFRRDTPLRAALFNTDRIPGSGTSGQIVDRDPRIDIADNTWEGENFVLLGKESRSRTSNKGVETRVDLIHGPLDVNAGSTQLGGGILLAPGRYYAWIEAGTDSPVGNFDSGALPERHPNIDMDTKIRFDTIPPSTCSHVFNGPAFFFNRGAPNGNALIIRLENWNTGMPVTLQQRVVPRGAFGSHISLSHNRFLFEVKLETWTNLVISIPWRMADVRVWPQWWVRRNPDASELKVVTYNALYDADYEEGKFRNAANLLATRGSIILNSLRVEERLDQGPWQWEADIIGLQEVRRKCRSDCYRGTPPTPQWWYPNWHALADVFRDEANARGSLAWQYVKGRDEDFTFSMGGLGPLFVNQYFWKNPGDANSIFFSQEAKKVAGCTEKLGVVPVPLEYAECHLSANAFGPGITNYAIPVKVTAQRYFGHPNDRPIVVLNMHLEPGPAFANSRKTEIESLISKIDGLLRADANAFNRSGSPEPKHPQNRILLVGDFNMYSHNCGEHYRILKQLRDQFGYAVDASLAVENSVLNRSGMHDSGKYDVRGIPVGYQSIREWWSSPILDYTSKVPWWASTYRGDSNDNKPHYWERFDVVFLVGLGWAMDDPVLAYDVMSDRQDATPMNPQGGGVEMWLRKRPWWGWWGVPKLGAVDDWPANQSYSEQSRPNYAPNHGLNSPAETYPGAPALRSDHRPVGARLRVFER